MIDFEKALLWRAGAARLVQSMAITIAAVLAAGVAQAQDHTITVNASPANLGTVSGGGTFAAGSSRTVVTTPKRNAKFVRWSEGSTRVSGKRRFTFILNGNRTLTARLKPRKPKDDIIVDRGARGLWKLMNRTAWTRVHTGNPTAIAAADLTGDGKEEIIFGSTSPRGTFINTATVANRIHPDPATRIAVGDFDGDGKDDLVATFQGQPGTFGRFGSGGFFQIDTMTSAGLAVGDIDGDGLLDIISRRGPNLEVCYKFQAPWTSLNFSGGVNVAVGDVNGDGKDDMFVSRGSQGVWRSFNNGETWTRINTGNASLLVTGDPAGNESYDVYAAFSNGLFTSPSGNNAWSSLDPTRPIAITVGDFDDNGKDDIVGIFPPGTNLEVRMNNAGVFKPMMAPPGPAIVPQNAIAASLD